MCSPCSHLLHDLPDTQHLCACVAPKRPPEAWKHWMCNPHHHQMYACPTQHLQVIVHASIFLGSESVKCAVLAAIKCMLRPTHCICKAAEHLKVFVRPHQTCSPRSDQMHGSTPTQHLSAIVHSNVFQRPAKNQRCSPCCHLLHGLPLHCICQP